MFWNNMVDHNILNLSSFQAYSSKLFRAFLKVNPHKALQIGFRDASVANVRDEELDKLISLLPALFRVVRTVTVIDSYKSRNRASRSLLDGALLISRLNTKGPGATAEAMDAEISACVGRMVADVEKELLAISISANASASASGSVSGQRRTVDVLKAYNRVRQRKLHTMDSDIVVIDKLFFHLGYKSNSAIVSAILFCEVLRRLPLFSDGSFLCEGIPFPKKFMARVREVSPPPPPSPGAGAGAAAAEKTSPSSPSPPSDQHVTLAELTGTTWISDYASTSGLQELSLQYNSLEGAVEAIKMDGDEYIPKGKLSWRFEINPSNPDAPLALDEPMKGQIQVAREGFMDPSLVPATMTLMRTDSAVGRSAETASLSPRKVLEISIKSAPEADEMLSLRCVPARDLHSCLLSFNAKGCAGPVSPSAYVEMIRKAFGTTNSVGALERAALRVATGDSVIARISGDLSSQIMRRGSAESEGRGEGGSMHDSFYWLSVCRAFDSSNSRRDPGSNSSRNK